VTKKQKRDDNDTNVVFNVVKDFNVVNENKKKVKNNKFTKNERDVNETFNVVNDDEIVRRETNVDENFFRDVFRDHDNDNACQSFASNRFIKKSNLIR
jgi:hypothetical protein